MKRIDIMTDIETLGNRNESTIFQIAAMAFDMTTGEIIDQFNLIADISKEPINATGSTIKWWLNTDKELLTKLLNEGTVSESELVTKFHEWIVLFKETYEVHLWGNGILFDNNIIRYHMESLGLEYPIKYNKDRDMRTIVELASLKTGIKEYDLRKQFEIQGTTHHDAFDDVRNQISVVTNCYKILNPAKIEEDFILTEKVEVNDINNNGSKATDIKNNGSNINYQYCDIKYGTLEDCQKVKDSLLLNSPDRYNLQNLVILKRTYELI